MNVQILDWVKRTRSDVKALQSNIKTNPDTAVSLCNDILSNLDELEKQHQADSTGAQDV